ncbi:MAG TPA: DUF2835 family protein [Modicisalibacter sp.]|nr:DUF2835 family protein [Modicisalibacter sp.]
MNSLDVTIKLSTAQCLAHYQGHTQQVYAYSLDGRRVVFPAKALRRIVTSEGVDGVFRLYYSDAGQFESIVAL